MIRNRNILRINLPKEVNIRPMNNRTPMDYEKVGRERLRQENSSHTKQNGFIDFGHTVKLNSLSISNEIFEWINNKKACVIFHIYYTELVGEIYNRLKSLNFKFDLIIVSSTGSPFLSSNMKNAFKEFNATFLTCPNVGKDIGGKLTAIEYILNAKKEYDFLIMAHDKKSTHVKKEIGESWRKDLYDGIFLPQNVNAIINGFMLNNKIKLSGGRVREGLVNSRAIAVNIRNTAFIKTLCETIFSIQMPQNTSFVGGTMFWMDWNYFKEIFKESKLDILLKRLESGNVQEPSNAHAMERLFGILVTYKGNKIGSV